MENFCRCCAKNINYFGNVFRKGGSEGCLIADVGAMLKIFVKIEIGENDSLPKRICQECLINLQGAYKFYSTMLQSQTVLSKALEQLQSKQRTVILPKGDGASYVCPHCKGQFGNRSEFKTHMAEHSKKAKSFSCYECLKIYDSKKLLLGHLKSHLSGDICNLCNSYCNDCNSLTRHKANFHSSSKYACRKCSKEFKTRRNLVVHMRQAHGSCLYFCLDCPEKEFTERTALDLHVNFHQTEEGTKHLHEDDLNMHEEFLDEFFLNEDNCFQLNEYWDDISLSFVDDFKEKADDMQSGVEMRYRCPKCVKNFDKQLNLKVHLAHEHGMRVLVCNVCGESFNRAAELKTHRSKHGRESISHVESDNLLLSALCSLPEETIPNPDKQIKSNFLCTPCGKSFKTLLGLRYHLKVHKGSKDYCCPYCGRKFTADTNLSSHIRSVHSKVKAHVCNLCDGRFATTDHLRKHVTSVHQKERNFLCSTCGKGFAQSSHLKQHLLVHTGERHFQCPTCSKKFFKGVDLSKHLEKFHPSCFAQ